MDTKEKWRDKMKEEPELTYDEHCGTKEPFPQLEKIYWLMVEAPKWMGSIDFKCGAFTLEFNNMRLIDHIDLYFAYKNVYENSKDFKVTWKLKELKETK